MSQSLAVRLIIATLYFIPATAFVLVLAGLGFIVDTRRHGPRQGANYAGLFLSDAARLFTGYLAGRPGHR